MSGAILPPVIPEPFAKNADPSFIQNPIPQTTGASGRASYDQGFPAITMQPVAAGGKPPFGQDFNGLFFALTSQQYFAQAGQLWPYNASVATAIGGYGVGSVLASSDGKTVWQNTVNGNLTDPDSGGAAGWISLYTYGYTAITVTGGSRTLTANESRAPTVILSGVLTNNQTIVFPLQLRQWLVVNNTSGAFTLTVRGASGAGVVIPPGGYSNPVGVYSDGTNFYPTVPASSLIPADQAATPNTLVERTNTGHVLANYFSSAAPVENPPVGNVIVTQTGNTFLQKIALADFESKLSLQSLGGQIQPGQIVSAAVTQFASIILANAGLTGTPTAPTAAAGTSTTQVATTAFANPARSASNPGFFKTAGGDIVARGTLHIGDIVAPVGGTIAFPVSFSAPPVVTVSLLDANNGGCTVICDVEGTITNGGFSWAAREIASFVQNCTLQWTATGF